MDNELKNFIKYCLGYIRITRERTSLSNQKYSLELNSYYFNLPGLINGEADNNLGEIVNLDTFYNYDPNNIPESEKEEYVIEKQIANKVEEIYNKYRNDLYTKQITLSFGYIELELPCQDDEDIVSENVEDENPIETVKTEEVNKITKYPLFSLPVRIEKEAYKNGVWKYCIYAVDPEVQVNIGVLDSLLGEDLYFQLLEDLGKYEMDGLLTLPINSLDVFTNIWHTIKSQLRLKEVKFDEESFSLNELKLSLGPKANYFLAEDLVKLSKVDEKDLEQTSLMSWTSNDELNTEYVIPHEGDLFFPFLYDKYQLKVLSILGNKASMIQGPPGTGKSETIANLLCHLAATGKRVLFVSQKSQALKVVKDKLKKLEIKYLFGYLPNPNSAQINENDEADGIAPQLSALNSYINKMGYVKGQMYEYVGSQSKLSNSNALIKQEVIKRDRYRNDFRTSIEIQRQYYKLNQELKKLKKFDIHVNDIEQFKVGLSSTSWQEIQTNKDRIEELYKLINGYDSKSEKISLDKVFHELEIQNNKYSNLIINIKDDVLRTGYDRHSDFLRSFNNFSRNLRLLGTRKMLPLEIIEYIDKCLSKGSRNQQARKLGDLATYCQYYETLQELSESKTKLLEKIKCCGVSDLEIEKINKLLNESPSNKIESIRDNILRVIEIKTLLNISSKTKSINDLGYGMKISDQNRSEQVAIYIQNIIDKSIIEKWRNGGVTIKQIVRKLASAFNKSKKAFKTFDALRRDVSNFNAMLDLIPIWIMELDDASRIIPLEAGIFDYVVLDEASQCNVAYTLPVMYRANNVVFVGDEEQMRDNTIMFKSNRVFDELARRFNIAEERQIKTTGSAVQSVLDIAYKRGFMSVPLQYHYRSPAELIGFSNKYFYKPKGKDLIPLNSNYLTYKDTNRIMLVHEVQSDWADEISDRINIAEAKEILKLFRELRSDPRYADKSVGILSFFNAQATYIRELFEGEGYKEDENNYKVSIIEGIQGDEKDIIIFSFVIRSIEQKNKYVPLTGESGDIRADLNKGRVNVAFSRAKLQVHCFISMPINEIPEKIWIKKYLEYARDKGEIGFYATDLKQFDSYFEEEFYSLGRAHFDQKYIIQNQVGSCGFKIDFVITNTNSGKKLAIECDGPCHFKDEIDEAYGIYIDSDDERQRVLEAAGWKFCRIKYSDWIDESFDRKTVYTTISKLLD